MTTAVTDLSTQKKVPELSVVFVFCFFGSRGRRVRRTTAV